MLGLGLGLGLTLTRGSGAQGGEGEGSARTCTEVPACRTSGLPQPLQAQLALSQPENWANCRRGVGAVRLLQRVLRVVEAERAERGEGSPPRLRQPWARQWRCRER